MDNDTVLTELRNLSPTQFEHFLADLYGEQGYETEVTQAQGDGGIDVRARRSDGVTERVVGVQAKRYAAENKVEASDVREYSWVRDQEDIDQLDIVTTSEFRAGAQKAASESGLELIDGEELAELVHKTDNLKLVRKYTVSDSIPDTSEKSDTSQSVSDTETSPDGLLSKIAGEVAGGFDDFLSGADYDERAILERAEEIEHRTYLSYSDAVVVAGAEAGLNDGQIGSIMGRSSGTVRRKRERLRQERRELADEGERTVDVLESV